MAALMVRSIVDKHADGRECAELQRTRENEEAIEERKRRREAESDNEVRLLLNPKKLSKGEKK
jgi:hypothetical protein